MELALLLVLYAIAIRFWLWSRRLERAVSHAIARIDVVSASCDDNGPETDPGGEDVRVPERRHTLRPEPFDPEETQPSCDVLRLRRSPPNRGAA